MSEPLISVQNIHKKYHQRSVLTGLSFSIMPGTFTTLLGANGTGKSTLLRLIAGGEYPEAGQVYFKGSLSQSWQVPHKQDMFYINENIQLESSLTTGEFVNRFGRAFPRWDAGLFAQMAQERKLNLSSHYHQFSRGQKMQFNLILALAANPAILLLDEITSVMDVYARRYFLGRLRRFCQNGGTVVMTSNIISELQFYTTHLLLLQNGCLKLSGALEEVAGGFVKLRFASGSEHPLLRHPQLRWAGMNGDGSENFLLARNLAENWDLATVLDRREITLEDIFIYHYADNEELALENAA